MVNVFFISSLLARLMQKLCAHLAYAFLNHLIFSKMKTPQLVLAILASFLFLQSCSKHELLPQSSSTAKTYKSEEQQNITKISQLVNAPNGTLMTPGTYPLAQNGKWDYESAYLFETNTGLHQIYVFDPDSPGYADAKSDCDKNYATSSGNSYTCSGQGSTCKIVITDDCDVCIITCLTNG